MFVPPPSGLAGGASADAWLSLPGERDAAVQVVRAAADTPGVAQSATVRLLQRSDPGVQVVGATAGPWPECCRAPSGARPEEACWRRPRRAPIGATIALERFDDAGNPVAPLDVRIAGHLPDDVSIAGESPVVFLPAALAANAGADLGSWLLLSTDHDPVTLGPDRRADLGRQRHGPCRVQPEPAGPRPARRPSPRVQRILTGITLSPSWWPRSASRSVPSTRWSRAPDARPPGRDGRVEPYAAGGDRIELAVPMLTAVCLAFALGVGIGATFYRIYYGAGTIVLPWDRAGATARAGLRRGRPVAAATLPVVARVSRPDQLRTE